MTVPALVLESRRSTDDLTGMAATAAAAMPNGFQRSLPGDWHGVSDEVLARALIDFFKA